MYDSVFLTFWKRQNYKGRNQIGDWQGLGWGRGADYKGAQRNLGGDGTVLYSDCGGDHICLSELTELYAERGEYIYIYIFRYISLLCFGFLFFFFLAAPLGMWDLLSSLTKNQSRTPCIGSTES